MTRHPSPTVTIPCIGANEICRLCLPSPEMGIRLTFHKQMSSDKLSLLCEAVNRWVLYCIFGLDFSFEKHLSSSVHNHLDRLITVCLWHLEHNCIWQAYGLYYSQQTPAYKLLQTSAKAEKKKWWLKQHEQWTFAQNNSHVHIFLLIFAKLHHPVGPELTSQFHTLNIFIGGCTMLQGLLSLVLW